VHRREDTMPDEKLVPETLIQKDQSSSSKAPQEKKLGRVAEGAATQEQRYDKTKTSSENRSTLV
jgi:hypothetical protein